MYSLTLCFSSNDTEKTSFKELLKNNTSYEYRCNACNALCNHQSLLEIHEPRKYLIIEIKRFIAAGRNITKNHSEITGFNYADIRIRGFRYKLLSAIAHHGDEADRGHYITYIRCNEGWTIANDNNITFRKNFVKNLKEVYLTLLEKI